MLFDIRQNLLMVRTEVEGARSLAIKYLFVNISGVAYSVCGTIFKEIVERQFDDRLCVNLSWGGSSLIEYRTVKFDGRGDLMIFQSVGPMSAAYIPYNSIDAGDSNWALINGLQISHTMDVQIQAHLRAVGMMPNDQYTRYEDLPDSILRIILKAFGCGWLRVDNADHNQLCGMWEDFRRKHDAEYKYTHNALGLEPDEKLPADLYDDHGHLLSRRHMVSGKTIDMMSSELANIVRIFELDGDDVPGDFDFLNPDWHEGLRRIAQAFIYNVDAKERLARVMNDGQFVINGIYAMAKDMNWIHINDESIDYQQSVMRRLLQELKNDIENPKGPFALESGVVYLKAVQALAEADIVEEEEVDEVDEIEEHEEEPEKEREPRIFPVVLRHDRINHSYVHRALVKMGVIKKNKTRKQLDKDQKSTVAQQEAALLATLRTAVLNTDQDVLAKLDGTTLYQLAACMTKMKDGDHYPRDAEYLKELIKHALR